MKTPTPKQDQIKQDWILLDAEGQTLGRLSTKVAGLLRGKHKPYFAPHLDTGDFVIIVNAEKVVLTGNKELQKTYQRYSGYPGGLKKIPFLRMQQTKPESIITHAVKGMLPKNRLGRDLFRNLYVYAGPDHLHTAQQPKPMKLTSIK